MDQKTIYSKTGKGVLEIKNKAGKLSRDLIKVLTLIDGKSSVADVVAKSKFNAPDIARFVKQLEDAGYIKEFNNPSSSSYGAGSSSDTSYVDDLDFTASLPPGKRIYQSGQVEFRQQESAARIQAEAEAKAKREEAEKRQRDEAARQARDEASRMAKIEAERKAKEAAALKARHETERKARQQAEDMTQTTRDLAKVLEAERKVLESGDQKKKEEAAARARDDAERSKRESAERQRREEDERKRKEADDRKRREEEEARKRKEDEERKRREEEEARRRKEEEERRRKEDEERKRREEEEARRREEEEARRRKEEEERKRREEEERKRKEEEAAARRQREEEERRRREEEDRRRAEEDARRREEDERRQAEEKTEEQTEEKEFSGFDIGDFGKSDDGDASRRDDNDRGSRDDRARERSEQDEARQRMEAAASSISLPEIGAPKEEDSGSFLESFERQQESLRKQAAEEERQRRERDDALAAAARAEREEEARQEAERRAAEDAEREERVERERQERKERERKKSEEYERKIHEDEERIRRQAEEKARAEAARVENERRAREEELARKRKDTEERERKRRELKALGKQGKVRSPLDRLKPVAIGIVAVLVLVVGAVQFMPMGGYIPRLEKLASDHIGEPVSIQSMSISALAGIQIKLENVKIGTTQDLVLNSVTVSPEFGSLFGDRKSISSLQADGGTMAREVLSRLPQWLDAAAADNRLQIGQIRVVGIKPEMREFDLPAMDAEIRFNADQSIRYARVASSDGKLSAEIVPTDGQLQVSITGSNWTPPVGPALQVTDISAKGIATPDSLRLTEWDARLYEGAAKGNAVISWRNGWSAQSEFEFARLKVAQVLAVFTRTARTSGTAEGKGSIALRSDRIPTLFDSPGVEIGFMVKRGDLDGVDLVRALQAGRDGTQGGSTKFEELSGTLELANGRYRYRDLKLAAGILTADGSFDIAPNQEVGGRVHVELRSQAQQLRNNLNVTGSLKGILLRP